MSSGDGFGTREFLENDYMKRMSAAVLGIYGNSKEEANYPAYFVDSEHKPLDGATGRYTITFGSGQLPPVNAFWSLTIYELPASLLTDNPIDRYLIHSPIEPNLVRDADGGITLYIQHESPRKQREPPCALRNDLAPDDAWIHRRRSNEECHTFRCLRVCCPGGPDRLRPLRSCRIGPGVRDAAVGHSHVRYRADGRSAPGRSQPMEKDHRRQGDRDARQLHPR